MAEAGAVEPNKEGAEEATAAPPPNIDVVVEVAAPVAACPNTEDPPPNILPAGVVLVAAAVEAAVEADKEREPNKEPAVEAAAGAAAANENEEEELAGTAVVGAADDTTVAVVVVVTAVVVVVVSATDVAVVVLVAAAGLPKRLAVLAGALLVAAETNENPVLEPVAEPLVLVVVPNIDFVASPAVLAEAKENGDAVDVDVAAPNPENTFAGLLASPASFAVGLQMLSEPNRESVGSAVAAGVGVLLEVGVADAAGFGSGNPVEVIVTLGAAEVLETAVLWKLKL